jgi:DNA-binding SARP family transcriptional activator
MTIRIQLLGHPLIEIDGKRRPLAGRKPWALLAFLLLESNPPSRRELAERLWPEADDPLRAVRWALLQVRRAIAPALVEEVDGRLGIADRASFDVDADLLVSGRAEAADVDSLVGGELLEGFVFDEVPDLDRWLTLQRSRLRSASAETLLWGATVLATNDPVRAGALAERAATLDPFDDAVHELIVDCHVRQGDRRGARAYVEAGRTPTVPSRDGRAVHDRTSARTCRRSEKSVEFGRPSSPALPRRRGAGPRGCPVRLEAGD